jgi:hypothetical protein
MKNIIKLIVIITTVISCKAQNQIIDVQNYDGKDIQGAYYKDINNVLQPFVGEYLYTNGNTSFKIILRLKTMSTPYNNKFYEDLIIGGFRYIENGQEKANTINALNLLTHTNGWKYSISGNTILTKGDPPCKNCLEGEKALRISLVDKATKNWAVLAVRRILQAGQPAIEVFVYWQGPKAWVYGTPEPQNPSFNGGYYTLIKQ